MERSKVVLRAPCAYRRDVLKDVIRIVRLEYSMNVLEGEGDNLFMYARRVRMKANERNMSIRAS